MPGFLEGLWEDGTTVFCTTFLNQLRAHELRCYLPYFPEGARILEVGGGTGVQAKMLSEYGFRIDSIDLPGSMYSEERVYEVVDYDGHRIPFDDDTFDVVFSSNVLEHIQNLEEIQAEFRRVLRPGGVCVHSMPSSSWRFWTTLANYVECLHRLVLIVPTAVPKGLSLSQALNPLRAVIEMAKVIWHFGIAPRHGEVGNALTELWTFSATAWRRKFLAAGYAIEKAAPIGPFYTGYMVLGPSLSIDRRERLARFLGSANNLFVVTPKPAGAAG